MLFDKLMENTFKASKLKRVRINVDPATNPCFGYENCTSFEGYVLEECGNSINVYILNAPTGIDPIQQVAVKDIEPLEQTPINPTFGEIKRKIIMALVQSGIPENSPEIVQIMNCREPDFIETYLKQMNLSDAALVSLYNILFSRHIGEAQETDDSEIYGNKKDNTMDVLTNIGRGAGMLNKIISKPFELAVGKNNIIARVNKFLQSFNIQDLVNIKNLPLSSKEYPHIPFKNEKVYISKLPRLPYQKDESITYQLKGKITGRKLSFEGIRYVVGEIEPTVKGLESVLLDFRITDNPERVGKVIFTINGVKRYSQATIKLIYNTWVVSIIRYGAATPESESKKEYTGLIRANNILKGVLRDNYDEALKEKKYNQIVNALAKDVKKYDKAKFSRVVAMFEQLGNNDEFRGKNIDEQLKEINELIDYVRSNI